MAYIGKSPQNGVRNRFVYAATQGQTAFTGADADSKTLVVSDQLYTDVYQNGVKLKLTTDWTATTTTVTLVNAASVDDVIEIVSFDVFSVSDTVPASTGGTFNGAISATSYGAVSGTTGTFSGGITATAGTFNGTGGQITTDNNGHITSKQSLDVATAGGRFIGKSNRGELGHVAIEQTANSTDGGYIRFATSASGSTSPTDRMRIDAGGSVLIGKTTPTDLHNTWNHLIIGEKGAIISENGAGGIDGISISDNAYIDSDTGAYAYQITDEASKITQSGGEIIFSNAASGSAGAGISFTERMRIASDGDISIGGTTATAAFNLVGTGGSNVQIQNNINSGTNTIVSIGFINDNGLIGSIQCGGSSTTYHTSSDYRLKENVDYTWDATTRLKQLKPARFNFIADDTNTLVDGFLAHEVSNIVPEAIGGVKDAMAVETRYTADDVETQGDTPSKNVGDPKTYSSSKIDPQGIDQSKLVPLLVKALQEQQTVIESLTTRITALEAE